MQGKVSSKESATGAVYVGIDVCKEWLDIHFHPLGESLRLANSKSGISQLKRRLLRFRPASIVMEATGKFHRPVHRSLHADKLPVTVIDPYRARMFARYNGYLAKTDRLDARLLALVAQSQPEASTPPSPQIEALKELVSARAAAHVALTALKNRHKASESGWLRAELARLIGTQERHIERLDAEIARSIDADPVLRRKAEILMSIPGIGRITAHALIAGLAELGQCSGKQIAMLAGLAPIANDSGSKTGHRSIRAGRAAPRQALYMAALSASRYNPHLCLFADVLRKAAKPKMVILVAVMRKLLVLANALISQNRNWQPNRP
jgi:transposase